MDSSSTAREGKASRNKRLKREALLESAYELFTQKGFAETTISDITQKAGVAKGTYYLYFKDKFDIRNHLISIKAEEALRRAYEAMMESGREVPITDVEEAVVFFAENIMKQLAKDPQLVSFISRNLAWGLLRPNIETVGPFAPTSEESLYDVLKYLFRNSPVKYRDPEIMLYMVVEFVGAACASAVLDGKPRSLEELTPYLLDGVRGIIRSQKV